jgi:hypothetical protein
LTDVSGLKGKKCLKSGQTQNLIMNMVEQFTRYVTVVFKVSFLCLNANKTHSKTCEDFYIETVFYCKIPKESRKILLYDDFAILQRCKTPDKMSV